MAGMPPDKNESQHGFTLIELSIVLVIIGLIVGGILVGQDLINAARIRAQISQMDKLNTAVSTFLSKYNALPGDMTATQATQFGFMARGGGTSDGDGNGLIDGCYYTVAQPSAERFGCETALFWRDLTNAALIEGNFSGNIDGTNTILASTGPLNQLPAAKLGNGNYIAVFTGDGQLTSNTYGLVGINYFYMGGITATNGSNNYVASSKITPAQAYSIDAKIDDGSPQSGKIVTAVASGGIIFDTTYSPTNCAISATQYNISAGSSMYCQLAFQFQ